MSLSPAHQNNFTPGRVPTPAAEIFAQMPSALTGLKRVTLNGVCPSDAPLIKVPEQGGVNDTYVRIIEGVPRIVRVSKPGSRDWGYATFLKEQYVIDKVRKAGLSVGGRKIIVPEVFSVQKTNDHAVMLMECIPGRNAQRFQADPVLNRKIWIQLGRLNRVLHEIPCNEPIGTKIDESTGNRLLSRNFADWVKDELQELSYRNKLVLNGAISPKEFSVLKSRFSELEQFSPQKHTFVHGNISPNNCVVNDNADVIALIDFGDSGIVFPELDIAENQTWYSPDIRTAFDEGYGQDFGAAHFDVRVIETLRIRRTLQAILWNAEFNAETAPRIAGGHVWALGQIRPLLS